MGTQVKVRLKASEASTLLHDVDVISFDENSPNLINKTGAKLYYRGNGWWRISGYVQDGHDTNKSLELVKAIKALDDIVRDDLMPF